MKKVRSATVASTAKPIPQGHGDSFHLSIPFQHCGVTTIAESTLQNIWKKAETLVKSEGHVLNAPWLSDAKARLVKSSSSLHPHIVTTHKANKKLYCCDDKCPMFAGFALCAHVVAVAESNGDLKSFLDAVRAKCSPNLTAIANQGLPKGAGRKGGIPKRKRRSVVPVQSRSVRPCLLSTEKTVSCNKPSLDTSFGLDDLQSSKSFAGLTSNSIVHPSQVPVCVNPHLSQCSSLQCTPSTSVQSTLPMQSACLTPQQVATTVANCVNQALPTLSTDMDLCNPSNLLQHLQSYIPTAATSSCSPSLSLPASSVSQATSHGQVVLGTGVNVILHSPPGVPPNTGCKSSPRHKHFKPFTLKLKTKQIKVCQSCRKGYEGENDTLGLVVAHLERRLISNPITGIQFIGKESNSHYHAHMKCLKIVDSSFTGDCLEVPKDVVAKLTMYQKVYLETCLQVPSEKLV